MRSDKLTVKSQGAIAEGQSIASQHGQQEVDVEHVLLALLQQKDGIVPAIVAKIGADGGTLLGRVGEEIQRKPKVQGGRPFVSDRLHKLIDTALSEASKLKDEYVSTEHLVLAMTGDKKATGRLLKEVGLTRDLPHYALASSWVCHAFPRPSHHEHLRAGNLGASGGCSSLHRGTRGRWRGRLPPRAT